MCDEKGGDMRLDPTSCAFDPKVYISHMYASASQDDFQQDLLDSVSSEAEAAASALQELLRDSVSTFVVSKETLDDMYSNDADLFTGDTVGLLANAFRKAVEDSEAIVAPTMELFQSLCACKATRERLAKFTTVWNVPGIIYEYCGARVPKRRCELTSDQQRLDETQDAHTGSSRATQVSRVQSVCETEDDTRDEFRSTTASLYQMETTASTRDDNSSARCLDDDDKLARQRISRGALEELAFDTQDGGYVLLPSEELLTWYGTPLARSRGGGVSDGHINFEAAVLNLRRAMVYLEEHCDLENAVVLGVEEGEETNNNGCTTLSERPKRQHQGSITITYMYAVALLRASLYLNERMAVELQHVSATDTVLIEDMLSGMVDVSIAAVKLRHFCCVARDKLPSEVKQDEVMLGLRQELKCVENGVDNTDEDDGAGNVDHEGALTDCHLGAANADRGDTNWRDGDSECGTVFFPHVHDNVDTSSAPSKNNAACWPRMEHPLVYYLRVIRNQHVRTMEGIARRLCQEADEWRQKFVPVNDNRDAGSCRNAGLGATYSHTAGIPDMDFSSTLKRAAGVDWAESSTLMDGSVNNLKDTATMFNGRATFAALNEGTVSERIRVGGFGVDVGESDEVQHAEAILEAFRTPETDFERFTTFSIGKVDMSNVLECSANQLCMYSTVLLSQLEGCAGVEASVQAHAAAGAASTFADRLFTACVDHLEVFLVSYWGGLAEEVHAGMFDFAPDPGSMLYRMLTGPAMHEKSEIVAAGVRDGPGGGNNSVEELPPLRYVPVVAEKGPSLRELSLGAVRHVVRSTSDILQALLLTYVNRAVLHCFVRTMSAYCPRDLVGDDSNREGEGGTCEYVEDEHAELHAALLVEVTVAQWEKAMLHVSGAVRRMKIVIGESCSSSLVQGNAQVGQVGELLEELEALRSSLFRCYTHGVGMLVKAYVTLLPSLQPYIAKASKPRTGSEVSSNELDVCHDSNNGSSIGAHSSVCARVSREFVSSVLTNKLLNLVSFVVDRTAPFLQRFDEVHDGMGLFAEGGEKRDGSEDPTRRRGKKHHQTSRVSNGSIASEVNVDRLDEPVHRFGSASKLMAESNSKSVLKHVAEHEETLLALIANILLVFVDALHHKCQRVSLDIEAAPETCECAIVESLADALCLSTTVTPIITNELIVPCVLEVVVQLNSDPKTLRGSVLMMKQKTADFRKVYLTPVEEHCQLLVDALLGMLATAPQQRISRVVQDAGFIHPMMDWQRVSPLTAGAVRPYVGRSFAVIARAHEEIQWLRQPILAAAVTQRLVAHLAQVFVTAMIPNGNAFEISLDCSSNFLTYGLLLIEAEGRTILSVTKAVIQSVTESPCAGSVLPELVAACEALQSTVEALSERGNEAYRSLQGSEIQEVVEGQRSDSTRQSTLMSSQRAERCEMMVESALQSSSFIVGAMLSHVKDTNQGSRYDTTTFAPLGSSVAEIVAERLAKRKEGYRHSKSPHRQKEKDVRFVETKEWATEEPSHDAVVGSASRRIARKKTGKVTEDGKAIVTDESMEGSAKALSMSQRLSVLRQAAVQEERRAVENEASTTQLKTSDSQSRNEDSFDKGYDPLQSSIIRRNAHRKRHVLSSSITEKSTFVSTTAATPNLGGTKVSTRSFKRSILR